MTKRMIALWLVVLLLLSGSGVYAAPTVNEKYVFHAVRHPKANNPVDETLEKITYFQYHDYVINSIEKQGNVYETPKLTILPSILPAKSANALQCADEDFLNFAKAHYAESDPATPTWWVGYELDFKDWVFGAIYSEASGTDGEFFPLWSNSMKAYITVYDEEKGVFGEPVECQFGKYTNGSPYYKSNKKLDVSHSVLEKFEGINPDGRDFKNCLSYHIHDITKLLGGVSYKDKNFKVRFYLFQGPAHDVPVDLPPGTHKVPLRARVDDNGGGYSMAANAIERTGDLVVHKDGSMDLKVRFKGMDLGGLRGHLLKLWYYPTIKDYHQYYKNESFYRGNKIELLPEDHYYEGGAKYPKTFTIPLRDKKGNFNPEAAKILQVRVDAMGDNQEDFNLLIDWQRIAGYDPGLADGTYRAAALGYWKMGDIWDDAQRKFTKTDEELLTAMEENDVGYEATESGEGRVLPIYEVTIKGGKADVVVTFPERTKNGDAVIETGMRPIDPDEPIQYVDADGERRDIEILKQKPLTWEDPDDYSEKSGNVVTQFRMKNVPISSGKDQNVFFALGNGSAIELDSDGEFEESYKSYDSDSFFLNMHNFDIRYMEKVGDLPISEAEKALTDAIAEAKGLPRDKAADAIKALDDAIADAQKVLDSGKEGDYAAATEALKAAIKVYRDSEVEKSALKLAIEGAEKLTAASYTPATWEPFAKALQEAKNVYADKTTTNDEVNRVLNALQDAEKNLVKAEASEPETPTPPAELDVKNLPEGRYKVDLTVFHSKDDGVKTSMADGAVKKPAAIVVENGRYYLELEMTSLKQILGNQPFEGYLGELKYGPSLYGPWTPAEVISTHEKRDQFFETFVEYYKRTHPNASEEEIASLAYPKVLRYPIEKPTGETQKTYAQVFVPVMESLGAGNGTQECIPTINWRTFGALNQPATPLPDPNSGQPLPGHGPTKEVLDSLRNVVEESIVLKLYDKTPASVQAFQRALERAKAVFENPYATLKDAMNAKWDLIQATHQLETAKSPTPVPNTSGWGSNSGWGSQPGWGTPPVRPAQPGWGQSFTQGTPSAQNATGPVTIQYEVPVSVHKAFGNGMSMADNAIDRIARIEERNGQYLYKVRFHPMQKDFNGSTFTGNLTNLFVYPSKAQANHEGGGVWSFMRNAKENEVKVAVWVDAMDAIAGGGPGSGEQDALLVFDWANAREVGRYGGVQNTQTPAATPQTQQVASHVAKFSDIGGHWAEDAIGHVVEKGYFKGTEDGRFLPDRGITRGEFVTVLGRLSKATMDLKNSTAFKDVQTSAYYKPYVEWAVRQNIVKGYEDGTFKPDVQITRQEMAAMMNRYLKAYPMNLRPGADRKFRDHSTISPWARKDVEMMARLGVIHGSDDGKFHPKELFTRAQVAQVLYNITK